MSTPVPSKDGPATGVTFAKTSAGPVLQGEEKGDAIAQSRRAMGTRTNVPDSSTNGVEDKIQILCGPLLNYRGLTEFSEAESPPYEPEGPGWRGSVLIVTRSGSQQPKLRIQYKGPRHRSSPSYFQVNGAPGSTVHGISYDRIKVGVKLYEDSVKAFWSFPLDLPLLEDEASWMYSLLDSGRQSSETYTFYVPSKFHSMRIMFHSCNGFSVGTDEAAWSGPALWNDVLRAHEENPFHVMIGGGDQIYNDGVRVTGPLKAWTDIGNPRRRRDLPLDEPLRQACDAFYFDNYVEWYSTEPFAKANSQIPQVNIWDDHDIIDGFGSYTDHFMKCPVFRGIGAVSFKYYCLFQHHIPPPARPPSSQSMHAKIGYLPDVVPAQPKIPEDECFILGTRPGPYISEHSRSLYMHMGARVAFLGIDARTERTRHQVNYPETYDVIFDRVRSELSNSRCKTKHLIVLLGVPIAYPRLIWLENIFTSPIIGPIRFLSKRFGVAGGLFNHFDGQVDLLDDLDDHYTARQHKHERKELMLRLQAVAQEYSIRVTILGGDVHLAAVGRFYSNPRLDLPIEQDHRYMVNLISSAITNKPPPKAVADLLARRNKIHHLNHETDETLMKIFDKDPGNSNKTGNFNKVTMPSRNYAIITESTDPDGSQHPNGTVLTNGHVVNGTNGNSARPTAQTLSKGKSSDGHYPLHSGEEGAGSEHPAANPSTRSSTPGGLDVCLRVEIDQHDKSGKTEGYGFSIPPLVLGEKPLQARYRQGT